MTAEAVSLPKKLFEDTLQRTVETLGLQEQQGVDGGPYMALESKVPMAQGIVGNVRLFTGGPLFRVVTCSIVVPAIQLDSHMMFAFTPGDSAIPHFTLDSVMAGDHFAFHLDLIPRVDMGSNLAYMKEVFAPLNDAFAEGAAIEGLTPAHLSPMQNAIMSPWMLAYRANEQAFENIETSVRKYQDHWFSVVEKGVSAEAIGDVSSEEMQARNKRNKAIIFSTEVDPVWERITMLIGEEAVAQQRALLLGADE
jgi:hypothetical protein